MLEGSTGEMLVPDFEEGPFTAFIVFLYTGRVQKGDLAAHCLDLLRLGDKYDLPRLRDVCQRHLVASPAAIAAAGDPADLLLFAERHRAPYLRAACIEAIAARPEAAAGCRRLPKRVLVEMLSEIAPRQRQRLAVLVEAEVQLRCNRPNTLRKTPGSQESESDDDSDSDSDEDEEATGWDSDYL